MAGVTNRAFRAMCRHFGPDLVYVNEMVMSHAVAHRNAKTAKMMEFGPDETPRSLQIYGSDPEMLGRAVHQVCDEGRVDHVDLNFGCPAAKVTRKGGGAAVPAKPRLLREIVSRTAVAGRCAVRRAGDGQVPDGPLGRPAHRHHHRPVSAPTRAWPGSRCTPAPSNSTTRARRAGTRSRSSRAAVGDVPVLGNGDIWEAADAVDMMRPHRV